MIAMMPRPASTLVSQKPQSVHNKTAISRIAVSTVSWIWGKSEILIHHISDGMRWAAVRISIRISEP